jgi:hypothetical protein
MVYIGIDLHAREFRMSVLCQHNSTTFEQALSTSLGNVTSAAHASSGGRGRLRRPLRLPGAAY